MKERKIMTIEQFVEKWSVEELSKNLRDHSNVFGYWMTDIVIAGEPRVDKMDWLINKLEMMLVLTKALKRKMFEHKSLESDPEGDRDE
jgi:hypothetical protein